MGIAEDSPRPIERSARQRVVDPEFARSGMQEGINRADPAMFITHLGTANLSAETMIEAFAKLLESVAKGYRHGPSEYETEKAQDLVEAAKKLRAYRG